MLYKRAGKTVLKQLQSGKWVEEKTHATHKQAEAHLAALRSNVKEQKRKSRKISNANTE